jgi:hypothetical protein
MSAVAALVAGASLGVKHALETDHLAAVATLVDEESTDRPGLVGASWGVGHSLPIVALAIAFVALGIQLPEIATLAVEGIVAVVLVALGIRVLVRGADVDRHAHDGHRHSHIRMGSLSLGGHHAHVDGESFGVGVLHGVAGSGALVVLLVAASPTLASAGAFLGGFVVLTVATMTVIATVWGKTLETTFAPHLELAAGCFGVLAGALLLAEVLPALL